MNIYRTNKSKREIFNIIIQGYESEIESGKLISIEKYIYDNKDKIDKEIYIDKGIYSRTLKLEDLAEDQLVELFELFMIDKSSGLVSVKINDFDLWLSIEDYKIEKIKELDLEHVKDFIINYTIELHDKELAFYKDKINVNYQNKFNLYQKQKIEETIPPNMFIGIVQTKKEILDYFFYERSGYLDIIKNITLRTIKRDLEEGGVKNPKIKIEEYPGKNKWEIVVNTNKFYMVFKDAQYWFCDEFEELMTNSFDIFELMAIKQ